ncbi:MAG: aspartyl protease family protein [Bacteroidota bacterium]
MTKHRNLIVSVSKRKNKLSVENKNGKAYILIKISIKDFPTTTAIRIKIFFMIIRIFPIIFLSLGLLLQQQAYAKVNGFILPKGARSVKISVDIQHNVVLIPIRINGSFEMNFILDTGAKRNILTEPLLEEFLSLDSLRKIKVRGLGGGEEIDAKVASGVDIDLPGEVKGIGMQMLILPKGLISYSGMFGKPVYGILGYEVFGQFAVEINYREKYIKLYDPFKFKARKKFSEIPIEIIRSKPYVMATLTDYRGEKFNRRWLLDTGASNAITLFNGELPVPNSSIDAFLGRGLNGDVYGKLARADALKLGNFEFEEIVTGYPDSASLIMLPKNIPWYGNLGSEILSRFTVVFNYKEGKVYLKKNKDYRTPFEYNISGLEIVTRGDNFENYVINYIRPNSPAAQAGIQINDHLLAINGFALVNDDISSIYATLSRRSGRFIHLKIKRGEEILKVRFRLKREI